MTLDQKSGLRLEYATSDDAEAIAPLFAQSFHDHAYFRPWADIFRFATKDSSTICLKVTDDETGQIISHGRWVRPKKEDADAQPGHEEERWSALDPYLDVETAEALFGAFERNRHEMMEDRKHYYMELLMTAEGHKGRGAGSLILKHGIALADEAQVECYIDASPAGRRLYERHGFVFSKQEKLPMDYQYNFGIRMPQVQGREKK
ncbi:acyl-CoA N-acyltransferase [Aureobasidium pullulans EXF-150]|uniref:Acyl-CoA N-acyltransferase n=1 Tax=Aureobasidium pullulans EXF-150 TaxID=1043002 RepID=A0A074XQN6_AURPU|nr:acyl-CoA N-acyltransferase [Aureobasidium pullulans EXF-150]KEQ87903.1 acyl-CoA N-acyltransferase [Aureobasidium pullulans EXF-150]